MQSEAKPPASTRPSPHDPGPPLTEAAALSSLPGAGWHCFSVRDSSHCLRTPPRCAELHDYYLAKLGPTKVMPCAPQDTAFCYGMNFEYKRYGVIECESSRASCEDSVRLERKWGGLITSDCIEVP